MIVLSRSKKAAVFTASLTLTPWSPPPRGAYAPLDIRLMDPYVRRTLPESGSFCVPLPPPPCPAAHALRRARTQRKERRGRSGAPRIVVPQRRLGHVRARRRVRAGAG